MASKNAQRKTQQTIALFVVTFLITLVGVTYLIKSFSPNVDVEIGGEEEYTREDDTVGDIKKAVDDRLKWIQLEDNMPGVSKRAEEAASTEEITYETEKEATEHAASEKALKEEEPKTITLKHEKEEYVNPQVKLAPPVPTPKLQPAEPLKMAKVYVGHYATIEQAIQAQNKLMSTSIGVSPFVKEAGGAYVLQAGSFANIQKAESIANQIIGAGFSARVVSE